MRDVGESSKAGLGRWRTLAKRRRHNWLTYRLEMLVIRVRDRFRSPMKVLEEAGVGTGMVVVDFGCGPGGFTLACARMVGLRGKVYAVDVQRAALERVRRVATRRGLKQVQALHGSRIEEVPEGSADVALLYDVLHIPAEPEGVEAMLQATWRVLKPGGVLSARDTHLGETELAEVVTRGGLFRQSGVGKRQVQFAKV